MSLPHKLDHDEIRKAAKALCQQMGWAHWGAVFEPNKKELERLRRALGLKVDDA